MGPAEGSRGPCCRVLLGAEACASWVLSRGDEAVAAAARHVNRSPYYVFESICFGITSFQPRRNGRGGAAGRPRKKLGGGRGGGGGKREALSGRGQARACTHPGVAGGRRGAARAPNQNGAQPRPGPPALLGRGGTSRTVWVREGAPAAGWAIQPARATAGMGEREPSKTCAGVAKRGARQIEVRGPNAANVERRAAGGRRGAGRARAAA